MFYFACFLLFFSLYLIGSGMYLGLFTSRQTRGKSMVSVGCFVLMVSSTIVIIIQG